MLDKQKNIEMASAKILEVLKALVPSETEEVSTAMRRNMDQGELQMYDLACFYEQEVIKAQQAGAHLAACLMCGAMNEAVLALMCLKYETEVSATNQYKSSVKGKPKPYRSVISKWSLEQFITLAEENNWVPPDIVNDEIKTALAEGFRELIPVTHPEMSEQEIELGAQSFFRFPGTALLRLTQELRNSIHAGKWLRKGKQFAPEHFTDWCRFGTTLGAEVRLCLLHLITQRDARIAAEKLVHLNEMLETLPPELKATFQEQVRAALNS